MNFIAQLLLAVIKGGGGIFCIYLFVMLFLRACVGVLSADEPPSIHVEAQGVYEVWGIKGRPFIKDYSPTPLLPFDRGADAIVGAIEAQANEARAIESGAAYVDCLQRQRFYQYVIERFEAKNDAVTVAKFRALKEECHL